jgi:hypothetical protein
MTKIFAAALLLAALAISSTAEARGGCGIGWHRGFLGGCYRNEAVPVTVAPVVVAPATTVAPATAVVVAPVAPVCPAGYHLGPYGRRCLLN